MNRRAVTALLFGAVAIASAPLLVKTSETGPLATAFWRVFLALPVFWAWSLAVERERHRALYTAHRKLLIAAGLFFAGDLAVWHLSIVLTSIANSTLLANLAPIFVALAAWIIFNQRPSAKFMTGLAVAIAGMIVLIGSDYTPGRGELIGDALGVTTAVFYAGYLLAVTRLRTHVATSTLMAWSGLCTALALLPLALLSAGPLLPVSGSGWMKLVGLALIAQIVGQSLIAYASAQLPATFSSATLLVQPVLSAVFAWVLLGESMGPLQIAGAITVLIGIRFVHRAEVARNLPEHPRDTIR